MHMEHHLNWIEIINSIAWNEEVWLYNSGPGQSEWVSEYPIRIDKSPTAKQLKLVWVHLKKKKQKTGALTFIEFKIESE